MDRIGNWSRQTSWVWSCTACCPSPSWLPQQLLESGLRAERAVEPPQRRLPEEEEEEEGVASAISHSVSISWPAEGEARGGGTHALIWTKNPRFLWNCLSVGSYGIESQPLMAGSRLDEEWIGRLERGRSLWLQFVRFGSYLFDLRNFQII